MKPKRKIIQIAITSEGELSSPALYALYALCDDGTIWLKVKFDTHERDWVQLDISTITYSHEKPCEKNRP